jgi:hypothetical protein
MEDEISEDSAKFCWVCFGGKMPASNILYNILWVQEDERKARIQQKKNQQTHKNYISNYGINLKKIIQQSPITILPMFLAGELPELPHKIEAVFGWVQWGFYGFGLWEVKMLWVRVMGVTLVDNARNKKIFFILAALRGLSGIVFWQCNFLHCFCKRR